eukprot:scaffold67877_cov18-Prasinocladus_malaysianus.AAC.1
MVEARRWATIGPRITLIPVADPPRNLSACAYGFPLLPALPQAVTHKGRAVRTGVGTAAHTIKPRSSSPSA